ncbi:MAG: heat-shock protein Hsp20 [Acidobacteria bacterium]|nr:MAG: heat-shock protein Hsp20 [Acidobacteriota bacterium]
MRRAHAVTLLEKGDVPMLGMTRWTPWTELAGVHRDLDSLFNRVFGDTVRSQSVDAFTPAADLRRDGDTWKVSLALPGIPPDKVDIDIVGRTLRVRGERTAEEKIEPVMSEITYGRFEREFTLPEEIDAQHVQATYRHGMLELSLPLAEGAKPHRIAVKAAPEGKQLHAA